MYLAGTVIEFSAILVPVQANECPDDGAKLSGLLLAELTRFDRAAEFVLVAGAVALVVLAVVSRKGR